MREFVNKHGTPIAGGVLLIALIVVLVFTHKKHAAVRANDLSQGFFIDEQTKQESVHSLDDLPPLAGKDGKPTVVRAMKFHSPDATQSKIIYLLKYRDETQAQFNSADPGSSLRAELLDNPAGQLVRAPDPGSAWVAGDSAAAEKIEQPPAGWQLSFPQH